MLQRKVDSKLLQPDTNQQEIAECLEKLYQQVQTYQPTRPQAGKSGFSWFGFGKKEKPQQETDAVQKGLYIFGSVGGGKTMLMNDFFDSCVQVVFTLTLIFSLVY